MGKSTTGSSGSGNLAAGPSALVLQHWEQLAALLPPDLEDSARRTGALQRRRGIRRARDLLRIVLAYALLDWSCRTIGAWCTLLGLAAVSDVAILKRLRRGSRWLGELVVQLLQSRRLRLERQPGVRLRLRDATTVSQPGSPGRPWRLHLSFGLGQLCVDDVQVTSAAEGESFARLPSGPGDIVVGDRGYAFPAGLGATLASGADVIVRISWQNLPLWDSAGARLDLIAWLQAAFADPHTTQASQPVWLHTPQGQFPLRWIACRVSAQAAERARRRARAAAHKKGRTPSAQSLYACDFILVVTSLPADAWPPSSVLHLYRLRWQIELLFKRWKSVLSLDHLRTQDPQLVRVYLLGKLLAALLLDTWTATIAHLTPDWFVLVQRPISLWRLTTLLCETLRQAIRGVISLPVLLEHLPRLRRFLCESPRRRKQQLALARPFLSLLSMVNVPPTLA